ncbi:MAG: radical SAM protein [Lachnospiraceae bacterium]|nr:radical SAM protein [Lachnospiraceae bacterium]
MSKKCSLCPRLCLADRNITTGYCGVKNTLRVARAALHFWEEPCLSGEEGSGAVFFTGCNLRCVFCQNYEIARAEQGKEITTERLTEIFLELQDQNANNINLVTATHYVPQVVEALRAAKEKGLHIPVVYNCGGYESVETLKMLEGLVDIYLPDFKYLDSERAKRYSRAEDYPEIAKKALAEMVRQQPEAVFDERGIMEKGVIVRHLMLPGGIKDSKAVVNYLYETYGDQIFLSLMNQYTPLPHAAEYPEINRKLKKFEYDRLVDYAIFLGVENGFIQEGETAKESFIPAFTNEGV